MTAKDLKVTVKSLKPIGIGYNFTVDMHDAYYSPLVSVQNPPYNFTKYIWIITENGLEYTAKFKRIIIGSRCYGYQLTKEIL